MFTSPPIVSAYRTLLSRGRLKPDSGQESLVHQLGRLQQSLLTRKPSVWRQDQTNLSSGIYIYGGVGTGKSRIADLFASTLPQSITSKRIHFHEFMVDVHMRLHEARSLPSYSGDPLLQIGQQICGQTSVLCFDEFQVSDIADAMILKRLFGSFWKSGGVMISTSNRHPSELYLNGLNRSLFVPFIQELQQRCLVWKVDGDRDYRMSDAQHERVPIFFTKEKDFNESLSSATNYAMLERVEIKVVMNRSVTIQATHRDSAPRGGKGNGPGVVAYATFATLVEASLGTSDYHSICQYAQTIYLKGLRQFAAHELDFVGRLITLIDIAYESRTRIVCFSTVPLPEVFNNVGVTAHPALLDGSTATRSRPADDSMNLGKALLVKGQGGSSSSMMSTFIDDVEWSATGLSKASLAMGGAGETDVRFAIGRALSRLSEMGSIEYGVGDE